ncbi:MAG: sulfatase-like hydrolase/transferase [Chloroflexota bacterium]
MIEPSPRRTTRRRTAPLTLAGLLGLVALLATLPGAAWAPVAATRAADPLASASPDGFGDSQQPTSIDPAASGAPTTDVIADPSQNTPEDMAAWSARAAAATLPADVSKPDIVLLIIDDFPQIDDRLWDRLPTIKKLFIDSGVRFTDYIGNDPLCCPGRANLLTGQWTAHHGVTHNDARLFDPRESIATELKASGYWTGIFGKYFNETGLLADKTPPGWSSTFIFSWGYWHYKAWLNGQLIKYGTADEDYSTATIQDAALSALGKAPKDKPRFIWLAPYGTHAGEDQAGLHKDDPAPDPRDEGAKACKDIPAWSTQANLEKDIKDKPQYLQGRMLIKKWPVQRHCETLLSIDRLLAKTLAKLKAQGRPDPMVILTADNGMGWGAHRWKVKFVPYATPIPLFIHWPALLGDAPATVTTTVSNIDIAPTLCAIAGCEMGPFPDGDPVDGISFLSLLNDVGAVNGGAPALAGTAPASVVRQPDGTITGLHLGRTVVFEEDDPKWDKPQVPKWSGVRTTDENPLGRWVFTKYITGEKELYDISGGPCWDWSPGDPGDPCELQNLAKKSAYTDIRKQLAQELADRLK